MAPPPQPGDGGVDVPIAEGFRGRGWRQEVPLSPQQHLATDTGAFPLHVLLLRQHAEREVVVGDVDVAGVVSFVGQILAALAVPPGVRLVPVVSADRHHDQPQSEKRQKETRHGQSPHSSHVPRERAASAGQQDPAPGRCFSVGGGEAMEKQDMGMSGAEESPKPLFPSFVKRRRTHRHYRRNKCGAWDELFWLSPRATQVSLAQILASPTFHSSRWRQSKYMRAQPQHQGVPTLTMFFVMTSVYSVRQLPHRSSVITSKLIYLCVTIRGVSGHNH